ncbi:hypothetical protein FVEG_14698 [Fusarium verticillioides 7600]|uniref:Uncharacterized protein n=1 Tax=Gibberella moniliformis (strain M3125 / FGSC 7600) TaxID=334819 RepID=W7LMP9_GIBM7|nr:hypothetical protein FVEG_14698 [Fusarium verticillioides 7600]EWG36689.1 hypothetical protein FVEG_14698 [Fusarium verticillioides 7600]
MSCQSHLQPHLPVLDMISLDTILSTGTQTSALRYLKCHFDKARSPSCIMSQTDLFARYVSGWISYASDLSQRRSQFPHPRPYKAGMELLVKGGAWRYYAGNET